MKKKEKWFDSSMIKEDQSKTTENAKHFILNNGTRKALFSPNNIHYFDANEKVWKPIDNSLKATENGYHANLGKYTAELTKNDENAMVEIVNGSNRIAWEYLGVNKNVFPGSKHPANTKRKSKLNARAESTDALGLSRASHAVYSDAEGNVDLDYTIEGNGVKENIIIKEKSDSYHYFFLLHVCGFEMKTANDGRGLEFYAPIPDSDVTEPHTPEFVMPAPFMYDDNGERSDDVKYAAEKIDSETFVFSVEANAEWINAPERVFPVCIDPQLLPVNSSLITVTHDQYQWCDCSDSCCYDSYWMHTGSPYYSYVYLKESESDRTTAKILIKKSGIDLGENTFISAKLVFQQYSGVSYSSSARIEIGNSSYTHKNGETLKANITGLYNSHSGDFTVNLSMLTSGQTRKFYIPTLEIEYQPVKADPVRKTFAIENNVSAELDVLSGNETLVFDDITDPALGVSVSHVYKPNDTIVEYGQNFRLNLDESLVKTSTSATGAQYTYTDPLGEVHTFKEHFYRIGTNGEKVYITSNISSITADADGRLWLNGSEVFRELTTDRGLRASSRLEGVVNNAEWVEQRVDEEKQLEEQIKSYKNTLCNFVSVNKSSGETVSKMTESKLSNPDSVESFLTECNSSAYLMLSKEEALTYKSMLTQKQSLNTSKSALSLQEESLVNNAKSLLLQYNTPDTFEYQDVSDEIQLKSMNHEVQNYAIQQIHLQAKLTENQSAPEEQKLKESDETLYNSMLPLYADQAALVGGLLHELSNETRRGLINYHQNTLLPAQKDHWDEQKELIEDQIRNFPGIDAPTGEDGEDGEDGTLTKQHANILSQINGVTKQISDLEAQIKLYVDKSDDYITQFKSYYKEYFHLKGQLDTLEMQIPVSYLISDSTVKGFNAEGHLVMMQDKYGKYVAIEREKYNTSGKMRVSSVYDADNRAMTFSYNEKNKLSEIRNSLGEKVAFRYDATGYLLAIEYDHQPNLALTYATIANVKRITSVASANNTSTKLTHNTSGALTKIAYHTTVTSIAHDNVVTGADVELSSVSMTYTTDTEVKYDDIKKEIYKIDQINHEVAAHYEFVNNKVSAAEYYTYENHLLTKTERAAKSCLNRYSYADFDAQMLLETVENVNYNSFKEPVAILTDKYTMSADGTPTLSEHSTTEYTYNDNRKLTQKKTTHFYTGCSCPPSVTVEKYAYDNAGELVRKESYVEGEELKTGINIEEHIFNDKGIETKSFTYNSLDPTSKLYTESETDEKGKTLATFDESGEHKTTFDYERDGVTVKTERLPNGSKFSYGRDPRGEVLAITHSTASGEENSTTQTRTLDVVTEIKSGNNTVLYEYDEKCRVKSVSLNGVDEYVTYAYSGEHTNAETTTATMADGTQVATVKNAHGNVTTSSCGDRTVTNTYNNDLRLTATVDSVSGTTEFTYDEKGNVETVTAPDTTEEFSYDDKGKLETKTLTAGDTVHEYAYTYRATADRTLEYISVNDITVKTDTDVLGRNTGKTMEVGGTDIAQEKIAYVKFGDHATSLPSTVRFATGGIFKESLKYKYDAMGNIIEVLENGRSVCRYEYDALGRLTREDNMTFGKTTTWAYDNNGNILAKYEYAITAKPTGELHLLDGTGKLYAYADNSDRLISYNGEAFVYDDIGNPTTYRGKSAVWEYGRQLASFDGNTFSYDARGRRTAKNGVTFTYDSNGNLIKQSNGLEFLYDHAGVFAVKYNGSTYFYRKNTQLDVIALLDSAGNPVVKYKYDAWGKCAVDASTTDVALANLNPFRYRSYYFDTETGLYFLKTRYYDPEIGRFMTIDDLSYLEPDSINGLNLYAYCGDNPVTRIDPIGNAWYDILAWIGVGLFVAAAVVLTAGLAGAVIGGIAGGIIYGAAIGTIALGTIGAGVGAVGGMIYDATNGNAFGTSIWTWTKAGFGIGAIAGAIIGGSIGGAAAHSVMGLTNTSLWTGLGSNGANIAANAASQNGLITIGQTFGGKVVQFMTNRFGYAATKYLWVSLSKTMASTVAMSSITLYYAGFISELSVFAMYELPILTQRGIDVIRTIVGG